MLFCFDGVYNDKVDNGRYLSMGAYLSSGKVTKNTKKANKINIKFDFPANTIVYFSKP